MSIGRSWYIFLVWFFVRVEVMLMFFFSIGRRNFLKAESGLLFCFPFVVCTASTSAHFFLFFLLLFIPLPM